MRKLTFSELSVEELKELIRECIISVIPHLKTDKAPEEKEFYTLKETAKILDIAESTMYALNRKNIIPYYKFAGKCHYQKSDIHDAIKDNKIKSISEIEKEANNWRSNQKRKGHVR
ncbi:helix-turn-helix domain-containing protein [Weeksellaceae bacterium TAE3-ERU29]|nr:helix-turn-helix domain-containing protein [Weeksellaceae bacterium TAE3-ERU29]